MKILSKYTDVYDYLTDNDTSIVFDRRVTREPIIDTVINSLFRFKLYFSDIEKVKKSTISHRYVLVGLRTGYTLYVLKVNLNPKYEIKIMNYRIDRDQLVNDINNNIIDYQLVHSIRDFDYDGECIKLVFWKYEWWSNKANNSNDIDWLIHNALDVDDYHWSYYSDLLAKSNKSDEAYAYPLIKDTPFKSYLDYTRVYRDIEDYLLSKYNDKDQESKGLTDIDKIINHGFDKRFSFRNVK